VQRVAEEGTFKQTFIDPSPEGQRFVAEQGEVEVRGQQNDNASSFESHNLT